MLGRCLLDKKIVQLLLSQAWGGREQRGKEPGTGTPAFPTLPHARGGGAAKKKIKGDSPTYQGMRVDLKVVISIKSCNDGGSGNSGGGGKKRESMGKREQERRERWRRGKDISCHLFRVK